MEELNGVSVKWYNIGMQLRVEIDRLDAVKEQYNHPSNCLRETLKIWLKTYPSPTWSNVVEALRSSTIGEPKLAADLECNYCSIQDTYVVTTHHHVPQVPAMAPSEAHTRTTSLPRSTVSPLSYSLPPQPHLFHLQPLYAPYYYPLPTSHPMSTPFLPPGVATTLPVYSQLPQVMPSPTISNAVPVQPAKKSFLNENKHM